MQKVPMTVKGEEKLRLELEELKSVKRPQIIEAIATARELGDLKENAEYHAAREEQSFTEGRIKEIESKLANAQIIDITKIKNTGKVIFGSSVKIERTSDGEIFEYTLVGEDESDLKQNKISFLSPIARGLIGKEEGDTTMIKIPNNEVEYEILEVKYGAE